MGVPLILAWVLTVFPQGTREKRIEEFKEERTKALLECGQRHLEYALELRDKGLTVQSAAQLVLAVEVSEEKHEGANLVLYYMRLYDDAFWKRRVTKVSPVKLETYEKKSAKLRVQDNRDRLEIVRRALARGLDAQAYEETKELLLALDEPLVVDAKGALVLPGGTLGGELATRVQGEAIHINGKPYVRDRFLARLPELTRLYEATSPALRVRSDTSAAEAEELLAAASALFEHLGQDLGAVPDRRWLPVCAGRQYGRNQLYRPRAGQRMGAPVSPRHDDPAARSGPQRPFRVTRGRPAPRRRTAHRRRA